MSKLNNTQCEEGEEDEKEGDFSLTQMADLYFTTHINITLCGGGDFRGILALKVFSVSFDPF